MADNDLLESVNEVLADIARYETEPRSRSEDPAVLAQIMGFKDALQEWLRAQIDPRHTTKTPDKEIRDACAAYLAAGLDRQLRTKSRRIF